MRSTEAILPGYRSLELIVSNFRGRMMMISLSLFFFVMILVILVSLHSFIAFFCVLVIGLY